MPLTKEVEKILTFVRSNQSVRDQIAAPPNRTLLYAGDLLQAAYVELSALKKTDSLVAEKVMLQDVLERIHLSDMPFRNLWDWACSFNPAHPGDRNALTVWQELSGIFASNAIGAVSFYVGSGVTAEQKVFASTEIDALRANANIDERTRDVLEYYHRCLISKDPKQDMNFSFISATGH